MKLDLFSYRLELKDTFTISHGSYQYRDTFILKITKNEYYGLGEATIIPYFGLSPEKLKSAFERVKEALSKFKWEHPLELYQKAEPLLKEDRFLLSAIDCAAWDWFGKSRKATVRELLGIDSSHVPVSSYTIGHGSLEEMTRKIQWANWPIFKIKTASRKDLDLIHQLRKETNAIFRIDANCSWDAQHLYRDYEALKDLNIDLLEQPLPMGQETAQQKKWHNPELPIIADESCSEASDVIKCQPWFDGINIKLMKCGGISQALEMIKNARSLNLKVMGGCMTESSIGISAMAQLSPLFDYIDLDGAALLANDPATGVRVINGVIHFSEEAGLGCSLNE
ncbi:MAG: dipeptide epimerase [Saprospirales bacterium]|nr:MAG: dipeptide epimerase [Saprospirales bacterium]